MIKPIEHIANQCGIYLRFRGALLLVRLEDCEKVVEACRIHNVLILGIEAFRLDGDKVMPDTDLIADFSELAFKPWEVACLEAVRSAEVYFAETIGQTELWFDFSLKR